MCPVALSKCGSEVEEDMGRFPEEEEKIQVPSYVQTACSMKALGV